MCWLTLLFDIVGFRSCFRVKIIFFSMNFSIRALGPTLVISDFLHEGACQIWWVGFRILCDV